MKYVTCAFCKHFILKKNKNGCSLEPMKHFCKIKRRNRKSKDKVCKFFFAVSDCGGLKIPDYCIYKFSYNIPPFFT